METKDWVITIGIDKFYLTERQKDFYLQSLSKGVKYVNLDTDKVLGSNFQSLVKLSAIEETRALTEGKWKCEHGKWHSKGWQCYCDKLLPEETDNMEISGYRPVKLLDK